MLALAAAGASYVLMPRSLGTVMVEEARRVPSGPPDAGNAVGRLATPAQLFVTFTTDRDLEQLRARFGFDYVVVRLAACDRPAAATMQVAAERHEFLPDYGRVRGLGTTATGRFRYRAVFDDALSELVDHRFASSRALGRAGGLCLSLRGASIWWGRGRSPTVPLTIAG